MTTPTEGTPAPATDRRIPLGGTFNVRDVGGYPAEGGTVRAMRLLRGDALHRLDDEARALLAGLSVRTVVDLREDFEVRLSPDALDGTGIAVLRMPVFRSPGDSFGPAPEDLKTVYDHMVDKCGPALAAAVAQVAAAEAQPVLVHCSAGKDRTGVVVAVVLSLLGVTDEVIAEDYHLTSAFLAEEFTHAVEQLKASTGLGQRLNGQALACPPELILGALQRMRAAHGSIEAYLLAHGLTAEHITILRTTLIEPMP
ncbi:tyrosine-protein phosphatase [Catenulispora subtropica]|uniref:tyrosine-protein phosphatase n=1 Tax=Catenulispora subtropica TaxID=450798 RepID=UPI0031CDBBF9